MDPRLAYRPDIDGLRAVAVAAVVIYHFGLFPLSGGFVGVDVFFVISGYLITLKIVTEVERTGRLDFGKFYIGRVKRLFPAMFATLVLSSVFATLLFAPGHLAEFGASLIHAIISLSNVYFWSQSGYFDTASHLKPLLHTWSLSVEEQFYLIWPALLVVFLRYASAKLLPVLFLLLGAASLYANRSFVGDPGAIFYLTPFRVFEFAIGGALVSTRTIQTPPKWLLEAAVAVGLALITYAAISFNETTIFPYRAALVPCLGAALVIYAGRARWLGAILRNRVAVGLGLISYSLYLVHWPLLVFYSYYRLEEENWAERWGLAVLAVALAALMYLYVERPTRSTKRFTSTAYGLLCAGLALVVIYPAASMWGSNGWAWRVDLPKGDLADFVRYGGGEGDFHKLNYGGADCLQPQCSFAAAGGDKFIVIGDSHGRMYFDGLSKLNPSAPMGFSVFERGACTFLTEKASCDAKTLAAAYLDTGAVDAVFLAQSWTRGNYETAFFNRPKDHWTGDPEQFASYYISVITDLLQAGYLRRVKHLVVMGEVPQFAGQSDAVMCIARPTYLVAAMSCQTALIAQYPELERRREFNRLLADGLAKSDVADRITFLNPFDALCDHTTCRQIEEGHLIYSDDDHLSKYGSDLVVAHFQQQLLGVLSIGNYTWPE